MDSYIERLLASQDVRFQAALAEAVTLEQHSGEMGAKFERDLREMVQGFLPATYRAQGLELDAPMPWDKQLDLVVVKASIPPKVAQLPIETIPVVAEIKTRLVDHDDIRATAKKLVGAAANRAERTAPQFMVLAGSLGKDLQDHAKSMAKLVSSVAGTAPPGHLWPAVFSFDNRDPTSAIRVAERSPLRAMTEGGDLLDGVIAVRQDQLSPAALCYLWIWAAIYARDAYHGMDFRFMRHAVHELCGREGGLEVLFLPDGNPKGQMLSGVSLLLPEDHAAGEIHVPGGVPPTTIEDIDAVADQLKSDAAWGGGGRFMLINLGDWVDEPDSWDESAWGGNATATRRGYGYPGMSNADLLNSCRLFWKFNPNSATWRGVDHAVVAHDGRVRAVVKIDRFIGPFWGRYGFQGRVVTDPTVVKELVGREVPRRQNPVTTIEL